MIKRMIYLGLCSTGLLIYCSYSLNSNEFMHIETELNKNLDSTIPNPKKQDIGDNVNNSSGIFVEVIEDSDTPISIKSLKPGVIFKENDVVIKMIYDYIDSSEEHSYMTEKVPYTFRNKNGDEQVGLMSFYLGKNGEYYYFTTSFKSFSEYTEAGLAEYINSKGINESNLTKNKLLLGAMNRVVIDYSADRFHMVCSLDHCAMLIDPDPSFNYWKVNQEIIRTLNDFDTRIVGHSACHLYDPHEAPENAYRCIAEARFRAN